MTDEEMIEHRVINALRAMQPKKLNDVVAVVEGMAKAFPKPTPVAPKRSASLSLAVSNGRRVGDRGLVAVRKSAGHDQERVLPLVSLGAV